MAAIRKRVRQGGGSWEAEVVRKGVPRQSRSFRTKAAAAAWAAGLETEINAGRTGTILPHTVVEAFQRYAVEVSPTKRGARWEQTRLNKLSGLSKDARGACGFRGVELLDLKPSHIAAWRDQAIKDGLSPSSVRREMNLIRSVLERCRREWGWLAKNPIADVEKPPEGRARKRRVSDDELGRLCLACGWGDGEMALKSSQRVAVAVLWAVETGMRAGEIVGLTPDDIDVAARFARLQQTKNGDQRSVPLSKAAIRLLDFLPANKLARATIKSNYSEFPNSCPAKFDNRVFGLTSGTLDALFRRACGKAGLVNLRFHDTRHEAITRLARKLDLLDLAEMIGHRDLKSLKTYYNPTPAEIAALLD